MGDCQGTRGPRIRHNGPWTPESCTRCRSHVRTDRQGIAHQPGMLAPMQPIHAWQGSLETRSGPAALFGGARLTWKSRLLLSGPMIRRRHVVLGMLLAAAFL